MNKNTRAPFFCAATIIGFLFFSCGDFSGLSIPESVSVKSDAKFAGALGTKYFDLTEKLGAQMLDDISVKTSSTIYKYIPDENDMTLRYLLQKDLYSVPLDVQKFVGDMNLDDSLGEAIDFSRDIVLPKVDAATPAIALTEETSFPASVPTIYVDMSSLEESIKSATIKTGSIVIKATASGASFSVATFSLSGITKDGETAYGPSDFVDGVLNLENAKLDIDTLKVTKKIEIAATISKSGTIVGSGQCVCSISISELKEALLDMSGYDGFEMDENTSNKTQVSADLVKNVSLLEFGQLNAGAYYRRDANGALTATRCDGKGIKFKAVNSLPAGNDIELVILSETFGIDSTDGIWFNGHEEPGAAIVSTGTQDERDFLFAEYGSLDITDPGRFGPADSPAWIKFSVKFAPSQTVKNLLMGTTYKLSVKEMKSVMDWDKAALKLDSLATVNDQADMSDFSIDEIFSGMDNDEVKKLVDNCAIENVPVYFLVQKPSGPLADLVQGITFEGKIWLSYKDSSSAAIEDYIAGSDSSSVSLLPCDSFNWPDAGQTVTKAFKTPGKDYSFYYERLADDVLNDKSTELKVNYNVVPSGGSAVDLYKARLDAMGPSDTCKISVEMAAVLPLKFKTTAESALDLYELAELNELKDKDDMIDRSDVSSTEDFAKAADSIKYLRLNYNFVNRALGDVAAVIEIDDTHGGDAKYSGIKKTINLTTGDSSDDIINFDRSEAKAFLTHLFKPAMTVKIPAAQTITLFRAAAESAESIGINPVVEMRLDENCPVNIKDLIKK
ncbi:MAG: hypothetical protein IJL24_07095 [Treponema sp.]|nr:hypothetical protein [Treponema sp.]